MSLGQSDLKVEGGLLSERKKSNEELSKKQFIPPPKEILGTLSGLMLRLGGFLKEAKKTKESGTPVRAFRINS